MQSKSQGLHPCTPWLRGRCCAKRSCVRRAQGDVLPQDKWDEQTQCLTRGAASQKGTQIQDLGTIVLS
jgi:hypothetical protein